MVTKQDLIRGEEKVIKTNKIIKKNLPHYNSKLHFLLIL